MSSFVKSATRITKANLCLLRPLSSERFICINIEIPLSLRSLNIESILKGDIMKIEKVQEKDTKSPYSFSELSYKETL